MLECHVREGTSRAQRIKASVGEQRAALEAHRVQASTVRGERECRFVTCGRATLQVEEPQPLSATACECADPKVPEALAAREEDRREPRAAVAERVHAKVRHILTTGVEQRQVWAAGAERA